MKPNRFKPLALALFCTTVIAIALALDADPRGHSTTQLGLSECGFKAYFNIPCPACGMTTSVTHWFHGEPLLALATQPFGAAFALLVSIGFLWAWKETIWPGANGWDGCFPLGTHPMVVDCRHRIGRVRCKLGIHPVETHGFVTSTGSWEMSRSGCGLLRVAGRYLPSLAGSGLASAAFALPRIQTPLI